jgi:predicted DNA-binding protein
VKRTNINLRDDQWAKLGKLSAKTGATMSALIRKAIDAFLKKNR